MQMGSKLRCYITNTFMLEKNGNETLMMPLKEEQGGNNNNNHYNDRRIMLFSTKAFLKEGRKENCCFAIIPKGLILEENRTDIPIQVKEMLFEFRDIIFEEMPKGLSPMRSNLMNLTSISRSGLPKKSTTHDETG